MTAVRTHLEANPRLVGRTLRTAEGYALCELATHADMAVDARGLAHGGFAFGLADYAAMVAVNDANVVLGAANVRLLAPVRCGDVLRAEAHVRAGRGRKREVDVVVRVGDRAVMTGRFDAFVLDRHVLD